jgi:hypothetical protein
MGRPDMDRQSVERLNSAKGQAKSNWAAIVRASSGDDDNVARLGFAAWNRGSRVGTPDLAVTAASA